MTKKKILDWIKKEKLMIESLLNHHNANVFALYHLGAYHISLKDFWNMWKLKRYLKQLNKIQKELTQNGC